MSGGKYDFRNYKSVSDIDRSDLGYFLEIKLDLTELGLDKAAEQTQYYVDQILALQKEHGTFHRPDGSLADEILTLDELAGDADQLGTLAHVWKMLDYMYCDDVDKDRLLEAHTAYVESPADEKSQLDNPRRVLITDEYIFLSFNTYKSFLILDDGNTKVEHQYGCHSCTPFERDNKRVYGMGRRFPVLRSCEPDTEGVTNEIQEVWPEATDIFVYSEALASFDHPEYGSCYLAVNNCD